MVYQGCIAQRTVGDVRQTILCLIAIVFSQQPTTGPPRMQRDIGIGILVSDAGPNAVTSSADAT